MTIDGQRIIIKGSHTTAAVGRGFFGAREAALRNALGPVLVVSAQD
jgi:hypothetical protein